MAQPVVIDLTQLDDSDCKSSDDSDIEVEVIERRGPICSSSYNGKVALCEKCQGDVSRGQFPRPQNLCSICLQQWQSPSCGPCGHVFCARCLKKAITKKQCCPVCRDQCSTLLVRRIYF